MWATIKPALIRAARTFTQAFLAIYLAGFVTGQGLHGFADLGLLDTAAAGGAIAVLTFIQNWLENQKQVTYERG